MDSRCESCPISSIRSAVALTNGEMGVSMNDVPDAFVNVDAARKTA